MKLWKKILIGLVCLIALPLIIALFVPKSYTVSVSETINVSRDSVYNYMRILKNITVR